ncbi:Uncharacterised protein [Klebsiella pneumoniae]|nr:Uncharacterised protein [Klebsiella pneumoniae]
MIKMDARLREQFDDKIMTYPIPGAEIPKYP